MNSLLQSQLGQYFVTDIIGRGSTSTVYKAYQASLKRFVAIKVLHQHVHAQMRSRFTREAHAVAHLQHPNILPVYDFVQQGDNDYLVMQYVENAVTLDGMLSDVPMEPVAALRIMVHLLSALDYAHQRGIIHRDVKPSNVLMPQPDWPLLADFGIAKIDGSQSLTPAGQAVGTAYYMAPEQGTDQAIDARSDLYSVGVVLYEMVTGRVPFDAPSPLGVLMKHMREPIPAPRSINPELPQVVEHLLVRALEKNPARRYQSAAAMGEAVQAVIDQLVPPRSGRQLARTTIPVITDVPDTPDSPNVWLEVPPRQHLPVDVPADQDARTVPLAPSAAEEAVVDQNRRTYATVLALLFVLVAAGGVFLLASFLSRPRAQTSQTGSGSAVVATVPGEALASVVPSATVFASPTAGATNTQAPASPTAPTEPTPAPLASLQTPQAATQTYVVQVGDTLSDIGLRFGVTEEDVLAANDLANPDVLQEGQVLVIPTGDGSVASVATLAPIADTATPTRLPPPRAPANNAITVRFEDTDWQGGYRLSAGSTYGGRTATWIYGVGTDYNQMRINGEVAGQPAGTAFLRVEGMDSEGPAKTQIRIRVNTTTIYEGPNPLPDDDQPLESGTWASYEFLFEASLLQPGLNEIVIDNLSEGTVGRPPFFMLDYAEIIVPAP